MPIIETFIAGVAAVAAIAETAVEVAVTVGMAIDAVKAIGNVLVSVGRSIGIIRPTENVESLGDRAIQASEQGIKPEDFDKWDDYARKLQEIKLDPERSAQISEEDKIKAGTKVAAGIATEELGTVYSKMMFELPNNLIQYSSSLENSVNIYSELLRGIGTDVQSVKDALDVISRRNISSNAIENGIRYISDACRNADPTLSEAKINEQTSKIIFGDEQNG